MTYFLELVINGISLGTNYALITLGFVMIYKATDVFNFATGSMMLLGAYAVARLHGSLGFVPAVIVGAMIGGAGAVVIERIISRAKRADRTSLGILTLGVDVLLATELTRRIGQQILSFGDPWGDHNLSFGPVTVPTARIAALVASLLIVLAFFLVFKFSEWGIAIRAAAEDEEAAELMGIRRSRVSVSAWVIAGVLATVAGVFLGTAPSPGLTNGSNLSAFNAIPAGVVGGLDSTGGAIVGGVIIGVVQSLAAGYNSQLSFLGQPLGDVSAYVVMLLVLLWRPSGLFGTRELARV